MTNGSIINYLTALSSLEMPLFRRNDLPIRRLAWGHLAAIVAPPAAMTGH